MNDNDVYMNCLYREASRKSKFSIYYNTEINTNRIHILQKFSRNRNPVKQLNHYKFVKSGCIQYLS